MKKLKSLLALAALGGLSTLGVEAGTVGATIDEERPNILIIITDDQRADGTFGVMPDTMQIFRDGGTHYSNAVATTPLCCPARSSIFSGRYTHNHGVTRTDSPTKLEQLTTMQYQLKSQGYTTALAGKYLNSWKGQLPYFDLAATRTGYYKEDGSYSTTYIRDKALSFLSQLEQNDSSPWLMFVNVYAPHEPAVPEKKYESAAVPAWSENPATLEADRSDKPAYVRGLSGKKVNLQKFRVKQLRTLYSVDDLVADLFGKLQDLDEDNTLAFYTSDNGFMWYEHKLRYKRHAYDQSIQIPMFVRWPGRVAAGHVNSNIVANIDIAPTVYDAAGVAPTNYAPDGRSMFSSSREHILIESLEGTVNVPYTNDAVPVWQGLWTPGWTYVEYEDGFREYYATDDPWQLENLFNNGVAGDEPPNQSELRQTLQDDADCAGSACP